MMAPAVPTILLLGFCFEGEARRDSRGVSSRADGGKHEVETRWFGGDVRLRWVAE